MKIHFKENKKSPEDYPNSPHIKRALIEGNMSICNAGIVDYAHITEDTKEITCQGCKNILFNIQHQNLGS